MARNQSTGPVMLIVMDGWGERQDADHNAVKQARTPNFDRLHQDYPHTLLRTSGGDVGLPRGTMGNSEVGHLNIGGGRIVWQELMRINNSIADGTFYENSALLGAFQHALRNQTRVHLFGLISTAYVHSCEEHYFALVRLGRRLGLGTDQLVVHVFTDGRDTSPRSGLAAVADLQRKLDLYDCGVIGTVIGRYYAMDRDKRWKRTQLAFDAMVGGAAEFQATSAAQAVRDAYARADAHREAEAWPAETDEFIRPTVIVGTDGQPLGTIRDGDAVISFNHRSDRPRQIVRTLIETDFEARTANDPHPTFARSHTPQLHLVTMTDYRAGFECPIAFESKPLTGTLGEVVSRAGLRQYHSAETEKYPHVTFFLNGGRETPFEGEERFMADSPQVATYDLQPEMSAREVTDRALQAIRSGRFQLLVLNLANPDMVGHTGVMEAAVKAVETVDRSVGELSAAILECGGDLIITADHGNCEQMWDYDTNGPHTAHTTNPVPCILISDRHRQSRLREGRLADLAPTLLQLLEVVPPAEMDGQSLIEP